MDIESKELKEQINRYQIFRIVQLNKERFIEYDESNQEHVTLLKKLWSRVFPEKPWQGLEGEHWKDMGFQVCKKNKN